MHNKYRQQLKQRREREGEKITINIRSSRRFSLFELTGEKEKEPLVPFNGPPFEKTSGG